MLNAIQGFQLPFHSNPIQTRPPTPHKFNEKESKEITVCIQKLLVSGAIENTVFTQDQFISNIFVVPKSDGGSRLVINLKDLNTFITAPHFKMEDIKVAMNIIRKGVYMAVLDQKEAFHRIPVSQCDRKYLRFVWEGNIYQFTCIPFGLNIAPFVFTKIMKPVLAQLRQMGLESVSYLDDALLLGCTMDACKRNLNSTVDLFLSLGLEINYKKSQLVPSQRVKFLGFYLDSSKMIIELPQEKCHNILKKCTTVIQNQTMTIHDLAVLIGNLISASPAIKYSQLYIRQLEFDKTVALKVNRGKYEKLTNISEECVNDIKWWIAALGSPWQAFGLSKFDEILFTDASLCGWGAKCNTFTSKGSWSAYQRTLHINVLELLAVLYGLKSLMKIRNSRILLRVDNTTAVSYINRYGGCRASQCHKVAKLVWQWCEEKCNFIYASYVNTKLNTADSLSRETEDNSDFMLQKSKFVYICKKLFVPNVDLFASYNTAQVESFISWLPDPYSIAVDAFSIEWQDQFYAFPPFNLISRVLSKINNEKVFGIVVVPDWNTQPWYPTYMRMCKNVYINIKSNKSLLFYPSTNRNHPLSSKVTLLAAVLYSDQLRI